LQTRYENKVKRSGDYRAAEYEENRSRQLQQMRALFDGPAVVALFLARFPCGVQFLMRGDAQAAAAVFSLRASNEPLDGVGDAVRIALSDVPRSSEQVLHPKKYWRSARRDEPVIIGDEDMETLLAAAGLHVLHKDTIGELLCAILTSPDDQKLNPMAMPVPGYWSNAAAAGWGGDRFFLLTTDPEANASGKRKGLRGIWFTAWDTPNDRRQFVEAYQAHRTIRSRATLKLGKLGAIFLFGLDDWERKVIETRLRARPPKCTRDGRPWAFDGA
jgi:hypothetical protein